VKILVLRTWTADCDPKIRSLQALGHAVYVERYDDRPHDRHGELLERAKDINPDMIVYIGAIERYHNKPCPSRDTLKRLDDFRPVVHLCGDGSDEPWWPLLQEFMDHESMTLQVNMDGNDSCPIANTVRGMITLSPLPPCPYQKHVHWEHRRFAGTAGSFGSTERANLINRLKQEPDFHFFDRDPQNTPYDEMAAHLCGLKIVANIPTRGSGHGVHVKGRVIETGLAGACLFERANPVTARWFEPGVEYMEFSDPEDCVRLLQWAREHDSELQAMVRAFYTKVHDKHHPRVFWARVFERLYDLRAVFFAFGGSER
jgi:Glycosyl transferases group 1